MFSRSCQYALRAVIYLARQTEPNKNTGVKEISDTLEIPHQFLAKILQQLSKQNLVSSIKGPNGGFFLSEENLNVTLLQVVECIDGPGVLTSCVMGLANCSTERPCPLHNHVFDWREGFREMLTKRRIKEFLHSQDDDSLDFVKGTLKR
jgi:Rrf2 family transcriptional regulator, iron-sulfur cluster assembly transcription factor